MSLTTESLTREIQERWISGHLYYHQSLDPVVRGFVHPLAVSLIAAGQIDAFFFLRFSLGGPHVRLRLRIAPGARDEVKKAMKEAAQCFLDREPSTRSLDEEVIRQWNESILANDVHETDDSVYPDNSFQAMPFRPEIERFGGPSRFQTSLDLYTLSSVAAIDFLSRYGDTSRSAQLAHAFNLILVQTLGFAIDEAESADLLRYGVDSWGEMMPKVVAKGDKVAGAQIGVFRRLFRKCLADVRSLRVGDKLGGAPSDFLVAGASRLSATIGTTDRAIRTEIGGSHLHMTASRLGLSNAEEVYLSRLLTLTLRDLTANDTDDLSWLEEPVLKRSIKVSANTVSELTSLALATLAARDALDER